MLCVSAHVETCRNVSASGISGWHFHLSPAGKRVFFFFCMQAMNKEKQKANEEEEATEFVREYAKELKAEGRIEKKKP